MNVENLVRDALELLIVLAIGGTLASALVRLRRGQIHVNTCASCNRPTSRAYPNCSKCGSPQAHA